MRTYRVITDNLKWVGLNYGVIFTYLEPHTFGAGLVADASISITASIYGYDKLKLAEQIIEYSLEHNPEWFEEMSITNPKQIKGAELMYTEEDMKSFVSFVQANLRRKNFDSYKNLLIKWKTKCQKS